MVRSTAVGVEVAGIEEQYSGIATLTTGGF
jgi:hypothetical protein